MRFMRSPLPARYAVVVLGLIGLVYWPVVYGEFVWDDEIDFVRNTWLTQGDAWKHYVFRDFHGWVNYFRPLVVALFTAQLRFFDVSPGPMHMVSLAIHLANVSLVGMLARVSWIASGRPAGNGAIVAALTMLLFGLHPAMVEPVAWIASQFELFATFFMLLGLLASATIRGRIARPVAVATSFFLAACCKESAAAFPLMLVVFDWAVSSQRGEGTPRPPRIGDFLSRNAATYAAVLVAGLAYLAFRHWALGTGAFPEGNSETSAFGRLQTSSFIYLRYWLMTFAPTIGMNPLHPFDYLDFEVATPSSLAIVVSALGVMFASLWFAFRRGTALACIVLAMTVALLPVMHIFPTDFDPELFHERYLMAALAIACSMLPLLHLPRAIVGSSLLRIGGPILLAAWAASSIIVVRTTIPMWRNSISLWEWAYAVNPRYPYAADALLGAYLDRGKVEQARQLGIYILDNRMDCPNCMLNISIMALMEGDLALARRALGEAEHGKQEILARDYMRHKYELAHARLGELEPSTKPSNGRTAPVDTGPTSRETPP